MSCYEHISGTTSDTIRTFVVVPDVVEIEEEPDIKDTVLDFIKNFQNPGTIETFTEGCCYWFALILCTRFKEMEDYPCRIMYNQIDGHFACEIDGDLFDITGQIEYTKDWQPWVDWFMTETEYRKIVIRDCILKSEQI